MKIDQEFLCNAAKKNKKNRQMIMNLILVLLLGGGNITEMAIYWIITRGRVYLDKSEILDDQGETIFSYLEKPGNGNMIHNCLFHK